MKFELNPEIIDQIIFAMENQNNEFMFDSDQALVITEDELSSIQVQDADTIETRYYPLPDWTSADGFNLMERFIITLRNPVYGEQLREALNSGKGVFRNFKNVLKQREDIQRLWYTFKDREMKNRVRSWYNDLCDTWGVSGLGPEPPETDELVLSDFDFRIARAEEMNLDQMLALDQQAFMEAVNTLPESLQNSLVLLRASQFPKDRRNLDCVLCQTPSEDLVAFLMFSDCIGKEVLDAESIIIHQLYVKPEYRGMGLAKKMLDIFIENAYKNGIQQILLNLWGSDGSFMNILQDFGFKPFATAMNLNLDEWGKKNCW